MLAGTRNWRDNCLRNRHPILDAPHQHGLLVAQLNAQQNTIVSEASRLVAVILMGTVVLGNGATEYLEEIADHDDELIDSREVVE